MAEDNMEISYDDHEDDDIDINIDIDQENQDDDFMIEDAHSESGTNDDVMQDEDNASFVMEDDDYMPDHTLEDVQAEAVEVTEVEMSRATDVDPVVDNSFVPSTLPEETQITEVLEAQGSEPREAAFHEETDLPEQPSLPVATSGSLDDPVQEALGAQKNSTTSELSVHTNTAPPSPPKSVQHDHTHDQIETSTLAPKSKQELTSEERTVVVQYNDTEYALVSSSESDDPDSYFLKDSHVLQEPLSIFFAVIREILGDEVSPQDELCLSIDDMGLETFETCLSNNDVTFQQLVDVHTTLSRNDGHSEMLPLYVTLNTKPEFGRSFQKMVEDAKSGHGLNEIMEWHGDDGTEVWAESDHGFEDETSGGDDDDEREHHDQGHIVHDDQSAGENEGQTDEKLAEQSAVVAREGVTEHAEEHKEAAPEQANTGDERAPAVGEQLAQDEAAPGLDATVPEVHAVLSHEAGKIEEKDEHDHDDEGDLIDYEDDDYAPAMFQSKAASRRASTEEDLSSPCLKPASCFCSSCNQRLIAEYHELNEKLDRSRRSSRSSSQTVDESTAESSLKAAPAVDANADASPSQCEQTKPEATHAAEPDQIESYVGENTEAVHEKEHETYEEADETAHGQEEDNQYPCDDYTNFEEEPSENQPIEGQNDQQDATAYIDDATEELDGAATKDEDEISYEDDDEAPEAASVPALVADAHEHESAVGNSSPPDVDEDEIDYDDDDHAEAHTLESAHVATITQVASAKRPHDEPDALDLSGQDAKRARA